jgi:uncharacterized alkaline shock family protein YloU
MSEQEQDPIVGRLRLCCHSRPYERKRKACLDKRAGTHHPNPKPKERSNQGMSEQRQSQQRGHTTIGDAAVRKIAGVAAQEVEKVQMGGSTAAAVGSFLGSVTGAVGGGSSSGGGSLTSGVSAEVGEEEAAFDLTMAIEYGVPIPQTTDEVRRNVISRVENLTGLRVTEVNITVNDVQFPEERPQLQQQQEMERQAREQEQRA